MPDVLLDSDSAEGEGDDEAGDGEDERCPGRKPHARVPSGTNANAFVLDPGVW